MKQSIFCFATIFALLFATACNKQEKGAPVSIESGDAVAPLTTESWAANQSAPSEDADYQASPEIPRGEVQLDEPPPPPPPPKQPTKPPTEKQPDQPIARQIIKTAEYRIQVESVEKSSRRANELAMKHGGFVSASELSNSSYETSNRITIRVPVANFDALLGDLGTDALHTVFKRISSQDVTEEYVDITTRLKTKKEVRDRYVEILRTKAKTVKDVLDAEEQIRIIQEEIEAKEGRLRYLKDQVSLSTINLELFQTIEYRPDPNAFHESFWTKLVGGLKNGWELLQGIVIFFVNIWPLLFIGTLLWWKRRWIWSKIRRNKG